MILVGYLISFFALSASWGPSINYDLMTFHGTLRDSFSFGKLTSYNEHLPSHFVPNISFSLLLVMFKHTG